MPEIITVKNLKNTLLSQGYCPNERILYGVWTALASERPLLLEGAPGTGKTSVAKALADGLGIPYIRLQMYEGLTDDKILYDYDYQKQLLTLEAVKSRIEKEYEGLSAAETIHAVAKSLDFYGPDFLIARPILRAITSPIRCVLCVDEIDKAPEEIEYMLYEFLEDFSITIPQYGSIRCEEDKRPIVFITSNGYRDLSGALRRRCCYLYLEPKTEDEMIEILKARAGVDTSLARGIAKCFAKFTSAGLRQTPSVSEAVEYARFLSMSDEITQELAVNALGILVKNNRDEGAVRRILTQNGEEIWKRA